jgi:hypothetical protein
MWMRKDKDVEITHNNVRVIYRGLCDLKILDIVLKISGLRLARCSADFSACHSLLSSLTKIKFCSCEEYQTPIVVLIPH